ncbi:AAA family ATPase [uncultured Sphingomonas sp.]|uniref:AAA family ATPase n=1 Tax=uncultured Sphingomonas sp. TaxID=158754 RepID=UPI0025EAC53F|nr:AAA family ATPase [uncultured Sphingomonas sp.]
MEKHGKRLTEVHIENFLSLRDVDLELRPLNVLVGPNGAGKTNLLKAFQFLGEIARQELLPAVQSVGGYDNLFYRGPNPSGTTIKISLKGLITKYATENAPDEYKLSFWRRNSRQIRVGERTLRTPEFLQRIEEIVFKRFAGQGRRITLRGGKGTVVTTTASGQSGPEQSKTIEIEGGATGLGTLRRFGESYGSSEWNSFAALVEDLRLFEIDADAARSATSASGDRLTSKATNVAAFLYRLSIEEPDILERIKDDVRSVLPGFEDFVFTPIGGALDAVRLDLKERHLRDTTPLGRASFGTIRAIALFAMLNDPDPPALTCLEEIDHGMHPHALDRVVDRLRTASNKTQILVATHSPALVNRLDPSELIIVEREPETGASRVFRPSQPMLHELKDETGYDLGELWFSGLIGGGL